MPVQAASGQPYGERAAQERAQRAVPIAPPPLPSMPVPMPIDAPTARPNEPLTAGIDMGAGPGSSALVTGAGANDPLAEKIRQLYTLNPTEELREILEELESS